MRHFLVIVRGIFLKGAGPAELWLPILVVGVMGVAVLAVASRRFRALHG